MSDEKFIRDIEKSSKYDRNEVEKSFDTKKEIKKDFNEVTESKFDEEVKKISSSDTISNTKSNAKTEYSYESYQQQWNKQGKTEEIINYTPLSFYDEEEISSETTENKEEQENSKNYQSDRDQYAREKTAEAYKNKKAENWSEEEKNRIEKRINKYGEKRAKYSQLQEKSEKVAYEADLKRPKFNRGSLKSERHYLAGKRIYNKIPKGFETYANDEIGSEVTGKIKKIAGKSGRFVLMVPHNLEILSEPLEVYIRNKENGRIQAIKESIKCSHLGYTLNLLTSKRFAAKTGYDLAYQGIKKISEATAPEYQKDEIYESVSDKVASARDFGIRRYKERNIRKHRKESQNKRYFDLKKQKFEREKHVSQMMLETPVPFEDDDTRLSKFYKKQKFKRQTRKAYEKQRKNNFFKRVKNNYNRKVLGSKFLLRKMRNLLFIAVGAVIALVMLMGSCMSCLAGGGQTEYAAFKTEEQVVSKIEDDYKIATFSYYKDFFDAIPKGCDEYHIDPVDPAGHNKLQMQAFFSAIRDGEYYGMDEASKMAETLFNIQYTSKIEVKTIIKYRPKLVINPDGTTSYKQEAYEYKICNAWLRNKYYSMGEKLYISQLNDSQKYNYENIKQSLGSFALLGGPGKKEFEDSIIQPYGWIIEGSVPVFKDYAIIATGGKVLSPLDCYVKQAGGNYLSFEHEVKNGPTYLVEYTGLSGISVSAGQFVRRNQVVGTGGSVEVKVSVTNESGTNTINPYFLFSRNNDKIEAFSPDYTKSDMKNFVYKKNGKKQKMEELKPVDGEFQWPLPGYYTVSSPFGYRISPITGKGEGHMGIDIPAPKGTSILCAKNGTVKWSGWINSYGNIVVVDHGKYQTAYAHCSSLLVKKGQKVKAGEPIALVGSTGDSTGNHLHFEVRIGSQRFDAMLWFKKK